MKRHCVLSFYLADCKTFFFLGAGYDKLQKLKSQLENSRIWRIVISLFVVVLILGLEIGTKFVKLCIKHCRLVDESQICETLYKASYIGWLMS